MIEEQPNVMKNYAQYFQYEVLLPYLKLTHEDEELAQNDPMEFINQEMDSTIGYTNLKRAATEVWTNFTEIGMKGKTKKKVGPLFYDNMNFLKSKL